jgi:choline dehydrogenase
VTITAADPAAPSDIDPSFFATQYDHTVAVALFARMRELFEQDPIADVIDHETSRHRRR